MVNAYNITGTSTVAAAAAAGTNQVASLSKDPQVAAVVELAVPSTQIWRVQDIYISAAADAGTSSPIVRCFKNTSTIIGDTPPLAGLLITNNSRPPGLPVIPQYNPVETMTDYIITTILNDGVADAINYKKTTQVIEVRRR